MKTDDTKGKGYGDKEVQFMCLGGMPVQPPVDDSFSATRLSFKVNETERSLGILSVHLAAGYDHILCSSRRAWH